MWLTFLVIGLIVGAAVWLIERRNWRLLPRLGLLLCTVIVFAFAVYLMSGGMFLGEVAWYDRFPYREIILFLTLSRDHSVPDHAHWHGCPHFDARH